MGIFDIKKHESTLALLSQIQNTDPELYKRLNELYEDRPGLFSRIVSTAFWALIGAGVGSVLLDSAQAGAAGGSIANLYRLYKKDKELSDQISQAVLPLTQRDYQHMRMASKPMPENFVPYSLKHYRRIA